MDISVSEREQFIFKKIAKAAEELNLQAFLIGGFVRDKIIGRNTKDADIVCLGDGIALANKVAEKFHPKPPVSFFKNFGTAQIKLPDIEIEFVGARKESYQLNSRKPEVFPGTLEDDQNRRDFTINALAISLNSNDYGSLIDPFNGLKDIREACIQTPLEPLQTSATLSARLKNLIYTLLLPDELVRPFFEFFERAYYGTRFQRISGHPNNHRIS